MEKVEEGKAELARSLKEAFEGLVDHRRHNHIHPLVNIIVIALLAVIAGADDFTEFEEYGQAKKEWLSGFLDMSSGVPSHDTFNRVFSCLDPIHWQGCFLNWVRHVLKGRHREGDILALDGKCLKGSGDKEEQAVYMVNAWSTSLGLCLAQSKVQTKSNEITALPGLIETLDLFDLSGCTVTVDAMGAQREVARLLTEKGASYLLALKDNQPKLAEDVEWLFKDALQHNFQDIPHSFAQTSEKGHGRGEQRRCWVLSDLSYLESHHWPGLKAVVRIENTRTLKADTSTEVRYYLSGSTAGADHTLGAVRAHWGVENSLHWLLDVVFSEDEHRARQGHAAENLAILRRLALNLIKQTPKPKKGISFKNMRKRAGWNTDFLETVLAQL